MVAGMGSALSLAIGEREEPQERGARAAALTGAGVKVLDEVDGEGDRDRSAGGGHGVGGGLSEPSVADAEQHRYDAQATTANPP